MAHQRHLDNAPITEAIIDIRITPKEGLTVDKLAPAFDELQSDYPHKELQHRWEGLFEFKEGELEQHAPKTGPIGNIYKNTAADQIVQFRLDGFTLNRLPPYKEWETFSAEAERLWSIYIKHSSPISIDRIAVRYINKIQIPLGVQFSEYLTSAPSVPSELPQELSEFLCRVVIQATEIDSFAIVTQALGEIREAEGVADVILDIDAIKQKTTSDVKYPMDDLESLRALKNDIFFKYITEKAAGLYE